MSAFAIDRQDYLTFAVQLHRFCNGPLPPHYTLELLRTSGGCRQQTRPVPGRGG